MNKAELITAITKQLETDHSIAQLNDKDVKLVLEAFADVAFAGLFDGNDVPLPSLGKLVVVVRAARTGRNPRSGEKIEIPSIRAVKFKAAKALKFALKA